MTENLALVMRILHLLSNRKWTERAEPVVDLLLAQQTLGHDVHFVCSRWNREDDRESSIEEQARLKGIEPQVADFEKHFRWSSARRAIPQLRTLIEEKRPEIIHVHMANAHLLVAMVVRTLSSRPCMIRSSYGVEGPAKGFRTNCLYRRYLDGLVVISERARRRALDDFTLREHQVAVIEPGIDLDRFRPTQPAKAGREVFGLAADDFVVGMVTRMRADRRLDVLVEAMGLLASRAPGMRLMLIGHGETEPEMRRRSEELGLVDRVLFPGYCRGEKLVAAYRAMDVLAYPVPGTDQSCRTVREAMASGVPAVTSRLGFLPELVEEDRTGLFADVSAKSFAEALLILYAQRDKLSRLSQTALETASRRFPLQIQARKTLAFYESLMP